MKQRDNRILDAIAVYICVHAIEEGQFIRNVNITPILNLINAQSIDRDKAYQRAAGMLREFEKW